MAGQHAVTPSRDPSDQLSHAWTAVSVALIALVPVADLFLPADIHLAHLLVIPVALTAVLFRPRRAAVIAVLAILALVAAGAERMTLTTENVLVQLASFVLLSVLLLLVSRLLERRRHELLGLRHVTEAVLRPLPRRLGPLSIASAYRAADAGTPLGGDLYAVARTPHSTRLLIGDVRGKGLGSVADTEIVLGAFRAAAHRQSPLPELVALLEGSVCWGLNDTTGSTGGTGRADTGERFVTAAVIDIPDGEPYVHVVSCGHLPPLLLHDGEVTTLDVANPAPPLGLGALADGGYTPTTFPFAPGDRLLVYTDGVTEARNGDGEFYPLAERAARWTHHRPHSLIEAVTADVKAHAATGLHDDMALVALLRDPAA
ncbi:Serine phosphatase RsbU, regulator of sigma subunit [Actinacidiphila rubida]|uniref:Serine phosphatase RsbU, regulator of sigma subunit n=2 Tax=Actinacidiphila rubida TaxID=310780 RepID=A0A1H8PRU9_9ACTN|nr:PP2C family protein-serine/threonine phosphatase [Actinacidiphila rubida]SEO44273.1 Serine phosphatase RsbU, regulator of sigma subunit [Actinacidiphila rubida]